MNVPEGWNTSRDGVSLWRQVASGWAIWITPGAGFYVSGPKGEYACETMSEALSRADELAQLEGGWA